MRIGELARWTVVAACLGLAACSRPDKIELDPPQKTFYAIGDELQLGVKGFDSKGQSVEVKEAEWSVADAKIVSVSETGSLRTLAAGTTTVSATVGKVSGQCIVKVVPISSVRISPDDVRLIGPAGTKLQLEVVVSDNNGLPVTEKLKWTTSAPAVVDIDASGTLISKADGAAVVTATVGGVKGETKVSVQVRQITKVAVHPETTIMRVAGEQVFSATVFDQNMLAIPNVAVQWKSSDPSIAKVDANGTVKAMAKGTCEIQAVFGERVAIASVIVN